MPHQVPLLINGEFVHSESVQKQNVLNPATQEVLAEVSFATKGEIDRAVEGAKAAFLEWKETPVSERARLMLRYQYLLKEHQREIAEILAKDTGKNIEDAMGDVWRGIEVVEHACNIPSLLMGETVENVAKGVDTYSLTQPLGVTLGITPFNFPAMIPLWMFPMATACGNAMILKPSEQVPLATVRLLELFQEAGAPKGLVQMIHGGKDQVHQLIKHPDILATSFVGSVPVAKDVYLTTTREMKRAQCFAGAKNHMVVLPDADKDTVMNALVGATVGAAGQRCMAISVIVFVGETIVWADELAERLKAVKPGTWDSPDSAYGPLISPQAVERVSGLIQKGIDQGANCLIDGRNIVVEGYPNGNWLGPTLFTGVSTEMDIYQEEIFGPVVSCMNVETLEDAINLVNSNPYGNGTSIFTQSGVSARKYQHEIEVGQVGINLPIPVPLPFFSFTGWKGSFMGDLHAYGKQAVRFYTETKTITASWKSSPAQAPNMSISLK
ncbi:methylmalonate-semialdehyde dehydrogenase (acylating) [Oleiphilus sp. HI0068]|uniref:CoA-acylating methylmalonate-semialdehyde dehydrogenase n=2 Tax=Oleiphilus TaxID=141450 RepID=UPI0007C3DB3A|nr:MULTISPECIES: CoA-acylating methylmalonate-semialdehyde dehydrogenase [unclassified Oleiphilus]KZY76854.1 methylmalonate-semialdehyde dehydrogenase (acylating) [Oleiphilus sp. HI0068]KZY82363.1 methylmalonate-semialdehyde dehydrogenase (acylating) [Oleiphilus sp. HI0069]KZY86928.1 methylmalonate-semialdehyde dehydrogenase (acylating) [Oleiphilus sp. HI0072]KZY38466.1 methylmalonate-semialdehyde dehydrogenase (acylating) [Oleiphilus sp. HI0043]KZY64259.1 methylmalonate-semialdehyde dehydroge